MAIKAFSGGIQNQPLPEINLANIADGDILVYDIGTKAFQNTAGSFTTLDQVNALIANINSGGAVDLSNYATTNALQTEVTNLTALIGSKATESYVDAKITALPGPTDLSDYITTSALAGAIANFDSSGEVTSKINTAIANATFFDGDYNNLFNTPQIPTLTGYATQVWVQQQINAIPTGGGSATALSGLTDVNTSGATTGQILKYNGSTWAPADDATSGGSGTDADTLDGFDSSYYLNYNNLTNTPPSPTQFSGDYNDLTNKPTIPTAFSGDYNDLTNKPTPIDVSNFLTETEIDSKIASASTGGTVDLSNYVTETELATELANYQPTVDLTSYYTKTETDALIPTPFSGNYNDLINKPTLFDGAYSSLSGAPAVPTDLSQLTDTNSLLSGASYTDTSVDIHLNRASAAAGQVLGWNGSNYVWVNNAGGGAGATSLGGLTDVNNSAPATGMVLKWNGNEWAPALDSTTGISGSSYATEAYVDQKLTERGHHFSGDYNDLVNTPVLFSGDYRDLTNAPAGNADLSLQIVGSDLQLLNIEPDPDTVISTVSLSNLGDAIASNIDYEDLQNLPNLFSGDYNDLVNRPNLFSGNYNDLTNKPYIPSIAGLASTSYVDTAVTGATTGDKIFEANVSQVAKISNVVAASQDNYIMAITTTDATITEVLLMSGDRIEIEDNSTVMYDIHVVGADSTEHHGVKIKGIIDRTSGTIALVGSPAKEILVENDDGWNADVTADTVNGSLKITVQGEASRTVQWTIFVELKTVKR